MRKFTYSDAKSHKFWNIELRGTSFTVTYGRVGAKGQTQTKTFPTEEKARAAHDKLVQEKLAKGYVEVGGGPAAGGSMRAALEAALVTDPDDLASHAAYADWLAEQGDPRGEFIQVQLALEDPNKSAAERKKLRQREQELLARHQRDWLGDLAPFLLGDTEAKEREALRQTSAAARAAFVLGETESSAYQFRFARGWLDTVEVNDFSVAFTRALARAPQSRLLRRLVLLEPRHERAGEYEAGDDIPADTYRPQLFPLLRSPYLGNMRVLQLGVQVKPDAMVNCHTGGEAAAALVKLMPKLEELYLLAHQVDTGELFGLRTLGNLRILQVYHNHEYPLEKLAKNPSLGKLTHLLCHPHALDDDAPYIRLPQLRAVVRSTTLQSLTHLQLRLTDFGDKGCEEIVRSGVLKRLKLLDLSGGTVTDAGAATLAACPELRNLEALNLDRNCLTADGIAALTRAKVPFTAVGQWQPTGGGDEWNNVEYLYEGDME